MSRGKLSGFTDTDPVRIGRITASKIVGDPPASTTRTPAIPRRVEEERRCHCGTKLSAYNPGEKCWAHSDRKPARLRASYRSVRP